MISTCQRCGKEFMPDYIPDLNALMRNCWPCQVKNLFEATTEDHEAINNERARHTANSTNMDDAEPNATILESGGGVESRHPLGERTDTSSPCGNQPSSDNCKDDRQPPFAVGDTLVLQEFIPDTGEFTGAEVARIVTYVIRASFGIPEGYCIMSI